MYENFHALEKLKESLEPFQQRKKEKRKKMSLFSEN